MKVIDVYDGDNISNFDELKASGLAVVTKATEGTTGVQKYHGYRYKQCKARNIPIGFYHMLCITSQPETQAENFYNQVKNFNNDIRNMLDVEYENLGSRAEEYTNRFLQRYFELSGQDMIIYSCESYFKEHFSDSFLNSHDLWVAKYSSNKSDLPNQVIWQYSDQCKDYGFVGNDEGKVDINELLLPNKFFRNGYTVQEVIQNNEVEDRGETDIYYILQRELNAQGFRDKNGNKLVEDGIPGPLTLSACPVVKKGASGNITTWIQLRCGATPDGIFGNDTENAVKWMQRKWNINDDGIVGIMTWTKLLGL